MSINIRHYLFSRVLKFRAFKFRTGLTVRKLFNVENFPNYGSWSCEEWCFGALLTLSFSRRHSQWNRDFSTSTWSRVTITCISCQFFTLRCHTTANPLLVGVVWCIWWVLPWVCNDSHCTSEVSCYASIITCTVFLFTGCTKSSRPGKPCQRMWRSVVCLQAAMEHTDNSC